METIGTKARDETAHNRTGCRHCAQCKYDELQGITPPQTPNASCHVQDRRNIGALRIRIGFGGPLSYHYNKEPPPPPTKIVEVIIQAPLVPRGDSLNPKPIHLSGPWLGKEVLGLNQLLVVGRIPETQETEGIP